MATFGENLKRIRSDKNLSQGDLAKLINMHSTHISRYERNLTSPTIEVVKKIAEVLEVSADLLVFGTNDDKAKDKITDKELLNFFIKIKDLPKEEQDTVKVFLNAFLFKKDIQHKLAH
jgi:transcriptional regulator with XRE-family HTH domain